VSHLISVQLDVLAGLLADLRALGSELAEEERSTAASGRSLERALSGPVGEEAARVGSQWAGALAAVAARTLAVAATLDGALAAYRAADLGLAGQLDAGRADVRALPR
jgi:hypothetical protein